jgi:hypothetical protein
LQIPAWLYPVVAPAGILLVATLAFGYGPSLPASLSGLRDIGPYVVLGVACAVAFWFNRGRAFVLAASLLLAYGALHVAGQYPGFAPVAVYTALVILVPLNALGAFVLPERGVSHHRNYRWLLVVLLELVLIVWIASAGTSPLSGRRVASGARAPAAEKPADAVARQAIVRSGVRRRDVARMAAQRAARHRACCVLAAFFIACEWARTPGAFGAFISTAGLVLVVALLHESHRMAFGDELTGLPARRALEEALREPRSELRGCDDRRRPLQAVQRQARPRRRRPGAEARRRAARADRGRRARVPLRR